MRLRCLARTVFVAVGLALPNVALAAPYPVASVPASAAPTAAATFASPAPAPTLVPDASPAPGAASTAASLPPPTAAISSRARAWLTNIETGKIDRSQLNAVLNIHLTDDMIAQGKSQIGPLGEPLAFDYFKTQAAPGITGYIYKVTFKTAYLYYVFGLDPDGKIAALSLNPVH